MTTMVITTTTMIMIADRSPVEFLILTSPALILVGRGKDGLNDGSYLRQVEHVLRSSRLGRA